MGSSVEAGWVVVVVAGRVLTVVDGAGLVVVTEGTAAVDVDVGAELVGESSTGSAVVVGDGWPAPITTRVLWPSRRASGTAMLAPRTMTTTDMVTARPRVVVRRHQATIQRHAPTGTRVAWR